MAELPPKARLRQQDQRRYGHTTLGEGLWDHCACRNRADHHPTPHWSWPWQAYASVSNDGTRSQRAMMMTPGLRKFALTAHVACSVGWLGAVAGFMALAVAGLASHDAQMAHAAYLAMELVTWFVIVP